MKQIASFMLALTVLTALLTGCGRVPAEEIPDLTPRSEQEILSAQLGDLDAVITTAQRQAALEVLREILPLRENRVFHDNPEPGSQETELLEQFNLLLTRYTDYYLGETTDWEDSDAASERVIAQFSVGEDGALKPYGRGHHNPNDPSTLPASWQPIWEEACAILPDEAWRPFTQFLVWTDGPSGTLAYVDRLDDLGDEWVLAIDPADLEDEDLFIESVMHEYMHYVTLNSSQVDYQPGDTLRVYIEPDFEAHPDSYINLFYQRFWTLIMDDRMLDPSDGSFYLRHQSEFISDYAAVHPSEDICESFTAFVLADDEPTGETLADQKLRFFYEFPELILLREMIRTQLGYPVSA